MKLNYFYILLFTTLVYALTFCTNKEKDEPEPEQINVKDSVAKNVALPVMLNKAYRDSADVENLINVYLVPAIFTMYDMAFAGIKDDNFNQLKFELKKDYPFLVDDENINWNKFLTEVGVYLKEKKSKYKIEHTMIRLLNGHTFPTVTLYELIRTEEKAPPVKEMSEFWGIDFNTIFPASTTFTIEYARTPLVYRYDIYLQMKRQESILEGVTFKGLNKIVLFIDEQNKQSEEQILIHEFSHVFFDRKTEHLTKDDLQLYSLYVEQNFPGGASTTVSFTYQEFNELMAKLSELIVLPDNKLYEFIREVSINKMPEYQKMRQLISSTTVYKYIADEHPTIFEEFKFREITNEEIDRYLYQLSVEKTADGKNKLRSYLENHVNAVGQNLNEVIFK
jgi:hypothetical protein